MPRSGDDFISALQLEAEAWSKKVGDRPMRTVYIGGGTPTVLSLEQLARVIGIIRQCFSIDPAAEFTIEANPNSATSGQLMFLRSQGVNRFSLGTQSFSDRMLRTLGRPHDAAQAKDAFRLARNAGFDNISIDLIYGIPGQTMLEWQETLDVAAALRPEHISAYCLSLDEGSKFAERVKSGRLTLPEDEASAEMYEHAVQSLRSAGYLRYEISNFSLPGFECRHNQHYWDRGEYVGLGPSASSFFSGKRTTDVADTEAYVRQLSAGLGAIEAEEFVDRGAAARESLLLGLRTARGVDLARYEREHGTGLLKRLKENAAALEAAGLLLLTGEWLRLTDRGFLLADEALTRLSA